MPRLAFTIQFAVPSLDEAVCVVGDLRTISDCLPFKAVSPIQLIADPCTRIIFTIDQGGSRGLLPIEVKRRGPEWVGPVVFYSGIAAEAGTLLNSLRLHLAVTSIVKYANASGWLGSVQDSTGFWDHGSIRRLVRSLCGGRPLPTGLSNKMRGFLLGRFNTTLGEDEEPLNGLAIEPLEVLLDLIDQEAA